MIAGLKFSLAFASVSFVLCVSTTLTASELDADAKSNAEMTGLANIYSDCAGAYDVYSELLAATNDSNSALVASEAANGAEIVHWSLLTLVGSTMKDAVALAKSRRTSAAAVYRDNLSAGAPNVLLDALKMCASDHKPLQQEMVGAVRAHLASGGKDIDLYFKLARAAFERGMELTPQ